MLQFDTENFSIPRPLIKVVGVGGGGSNAVNFMHKLGIKDVTFAVCNTDAQALFQSPVEQKIQLGRTLTEGRGAGNKPEQGRLSAIESMQDIEEMLSDGTAMVFVTAGMGGGTGTGAAPEIAKVAFGKGILTIAIVTIPFRFEGKRRIDQAIDGIARMIEHVDSLLVINNEKLREIYGNLGITEAFSRADNVLATAAKGIAEIITIHGKVNVDFADVDTVLRKSGVAVMGTGIAEGPNRAVDAITMALESPLLESSQIRGASNILMNICTGGHLNEVTMGEVTAISNYVQECAVDTNIIWGSSEDPSLGASLSVTIIAAGFDSDIIPLIKLRQARKDNPGGEGSQGLGTLGEERSSRVPFSGSAEPGGSARSQAEKADATSPTTTEVRPNFPSTENASGNTPDVRLLGTGNGSFTPEQHLSIEELEKIPAYKRRNFNLGSTDLYQKDLSSLSVRLDKDGQVSLSSNRYLGRKLD
jgi:cell division protein FtsZ